MKAEPPYRTRDWERLWDQVAAATAGIPPFESVYSGPAWPVAGPAKEGDPAVWKVAVLERREGRGAEHWGHLYIIVGHRPADVVIHLEEGPLGDPNRPGIVPLPVRPGLPLQIRYRPRSLETSGRLGAFAGAFELKAVELASR